MVSSAVRFAKLVFRVYRVPELSPKGSTSSVDTSRGEHDFAGIGGIAGDVLRRIRGHRF